VSLYFHQARYYAHASGRFLTEDPIGFEAGVNFYVYTANNPVQYVDPYGTCIIELWVVPTGPKNDGFLYHAFLTFYDNSAQSGIPAPTMIFRGGPALGEGDPILEGNKFPLNKTSIDQPREAVYVRRERCYR